MTARDNLVARLEQEMRSRGLGLREFADDVLQIDHAILSRFLNGKQAGLSRATVRKIAAALDMAASEIEDALAEQEAQRRGRHRPGLGPADESPDLAAQLADIRAAVEEIKALQAAGRIPVAWGGPPPEQPPIPGVVGRLEWLPVADDALRSEGIRQGSIAWVDPHAEPRPGAVVRVGRGAEARLAVHAPDLFDVTGVVRLVQTTL